MGNIRCKGCKALILGDSKKCPLCGASTKSLFDLMSQIFSEIFKFLGWFFIILVVFCVIAFFWSKDKSDQPAKNQSEAAYRSQESTTASTAPLTTNAARWVELSPTVYFLRPAESLKINAMASLNGEKIALTLIDTSGEYCKKGVETGISSAGVFRVNATNVKFVEACLNGSRVLAPETDKGKTFFLSEISTRPTIVNIGFGKTLSFNGENFEFVKKAMITARSAL
ncbi:hypothetical protein D3C84_398470 [compost metagenome]